MVEPECRVAVSGPLSTSWIAVTPNRLFGITRAVTLAGIVWATRGFSDSSARWLLPAATTSTDSTLPTTIPRNFTSAWPGSPSPVLVRIAFTGTFSANCPV